MSLSKNQQKFITSLRLKKNRQKHNLFVAEGVKVVQELLNSDFDVEQLFVLEGSSFQVNCPQYVISEQELKKISSLKAPNKVLGVFKIPQEFQEYSSGLTVALDAVNDPGNLGTIIRLCDWFGVRNLICSQQTVGCYNPKVVQSTMGSITRVQVTYVDLPSFLEQTKLPVYIADMDGENIYQSSLPKDAILVMGNEANGVSEQVREMVSQKLTIPRFGSLNLTESLNVATATAILLSEFRR